MGQTTFTGPVVSQNGFIDNSFTDAERDAIVDPQPGLLIWNTTSNEYQVCTVGGGSPTWDSAFGGGGGGGGPNITSVSPSNGTVGTSVTITGTGFTGTTSVTFGGISASFMVMNDTTILTSSQASTYNVAVDVIVTTPGGSSTEVAAFTNTTQPAPAPSIMALNPNTVSTSGGPFDIYGSYFTGATAVTIGSNPAASFNVVNDGFIQVSAGPQPVGSVNVSVTTPSGTSSPNGSSVLTYAAPGPTTYTLGVDYNNGTGGPTVNWFSSPGLNFMAMGFNSGAAYNAFTNAQLGTTVTFVLTGGTYTADISVVNSNNWDLINATFPQFTSEVPQSITF